jgi:hypothetical protein
VPAEVLSDIKALHARNKSRDKPTAQVALTSMPAPIYCQNYYASGVIAGVEGGPISGVLPQIGPPAASFPAPIAPATEAQSSPPYRPGDDDDNLTLYLRWLGTKYPCNSEVFIRFGDILVEEGWSFSALRMIPDKGFQAMKLSLGFVHKMRSI